MGIRITTTSRAEINALAYQGIRPADCHAQIQETIRKQETLGAEYADLFAEPVVSRRESFIDWYVASEGQITPFTSLEPGRQTTVYAEFMRRAIRIRQFADELIRTDDPQKVTRGNILKLALQYPGEKDLYLVGDRPVVTCWGFGPGDMWQTPCSLCDPLTRQKRGPVQVHATERIGRKEIRAVPERHLLRWIIPLLLLILLLLILCTRTGSVPPVSGYELLHVPGFLERTCETAMQLRKEVAALEQELEQRQRDVFVHTEACRREMPVKKAPAAEEKLDIPQDAHDTRFMKGRWLCDTGLINSTTGDAVRVEFVFEENGKGVGIVYEPKDVCRGTAEARMDGDTLHITQNSLRCTQTGSSYEGNDIVCRKNTRGRTECHGKNQQGADWEALFYKLSEE